MTRNALICGIAFILIAASTLTAAAAASYAIAHGASPRVVRFPFHFICHGIPHRCFVLFGQPMPICARCTGVYFGIMGGVVLFGLLPFLRRRVLPSVYAVALIVPLFIDGVSQATGLRESTNPLRLTTGIIAGLAILWAMTRIQFTPDMASRETLDSNVKPAM
jgi:uncharacterized membrane protein